MIDEHGAESAFLNVPDFEKELGTPYQALIEATKRQYKALVESELKLEEQKEQGKSLAGKFEKFILQVLEAVDYGEGLLRETTLGSTADWENLSQVLYLLQKALKSIGVEADEPRPGELFTPGRHYCVSSERSDRFASDTVLRLVKKGYRWGGRSLRPAYVITTSRS